MNFSKRLQLRRKDNFPSPLVEEMNSALQRYISVSVNYRWGLDFGNLIFEYVQLLGGNAVSFLYIYHNILMFCRERQDSVNSNIMGGRSKSSHD